jgi:uncharacterized protein (DUF2384 family)
MTDIRIESVSSPFTDPRSGTLAARVLAYAATINLLGDSAIRLLDLKAWKSVLAGLQGAGLGRITPLRSAAQTMSGKEFAAEVGRLYEAIEQSPIPQSEWGPMRSLLGDDLLEKLLHASRASIQRYSSGARATPQDVAERLHVLALVASDLSGSYNAFGIRRWFERPRAQLGGRSPAALLRSGWKPEDEPVRRIRSLAAELIGAGAT